jgi:hopanoid-associated phosphorylase
VSRIGIITGMRVEEDCLAAALSRLPDRNRPLLYCAGASAERAHEGARRLIVEGAAGLLSIGIAGGLDAGLRPGDIVLPDTVLCTDGTQHRASEAWHAAVVSGLPGVAIGTLMAARTPLASVAEKASVRAASGALAVDMESGAVGKAAADARLPFLALRIIADPADRAIPATALHGIAPDGSRRPLAVLLGLMRRPTDLVPLVRLARDSDAALRQLRRVASLVGSALFTLPG